MTSFIYIIPLLIASTYCQDYYEGPRNFSIELVHFSSLQTDGHIVVSPFGVWTLMTGVALGATGKTYKEIQRAFIFPDGDKKLLNAYKNVTKAVINPTTPEVFLSSTNFMFLDKNFHINHEYKLYIQQDFGATIKVLDFNDPTSAAKNANSYIDRSGGRVANVLTSDDFAESRMILTNVISFKGLWGLPFNQNDTTVEPFYTENKQRLGDVNMMYQRGKFPYSNIRLIKASTLELPYGKDEKYSMLVILPHIRVNVADVYSSLSTISLKEIFGILQKDKDEFGLEDIDVRLPRFKISTNVVLNKPLNDMGVVEMFEPTLASFGRVTKESLFVSAIVHKADIEVTEAGTVASASTTADFSDRISTPSFQANRPFIYFIVEKTTTTVIFGGIYSKPTVF